MEDEHICVALICGLDALYGRTIHSPGEWNIISDTLWYICGYPERDLIIVRVDTAVDLDSDGALLRVTLTGIRVGAAGFCEDELIFSVKRRFVSALPVERALSVISMPILPVSLSMTFTGDAERRLESLLSALLPIIVVLPETLILPSLVARTPPPLQFVTVAFFNVKEPPVTVIPAISVAESVPSNFKEDIVVAPDVMINGSLQVLTM